MKLVICDTAAEAAARAAQALAAALDARPAPTLGLATGETMRPVYARLVALARSGDADFSRARLFALDEYEGLGPDQAASFHAYLRAALLEPLGFPPEREHLLKGDAPDPAAEAARYEASIRAAGGIDLQLLGLGRNGHIAFNEPGSPFASRTRLVTLAEDTRAAAAAAFAPGAPPRRALTLGIGTILEARAVLLVATGAAKAEAVARMVEGAPDTDCPATALRAHPDATAILDRAAAARLSQSALRPERNEDRKNRAQGQKAGAAGLTLSGRKPV